MNILLVPDRLYWGAHRTAEAIQAQSGKHSIKIKAVVSLTDEDFQDIDLAVAMLNSCERTIHDYAQRNHVPVAVRIAGWTGIFRKYRRWHKNWPLAGVCTISPQLGTVVQKLYPEHDVAVLPIGVDVNSFNAPLNHGVNPEDFTVGWVGREHDIVKGYWWLNLDDFKEFNIKTKLQDRPKGIDGPVTPTDWPHEMVEYYNTIDALICTSSVEGGPKVVLEAMACRKPVVSTPVGIVPYVVEPEYLVTNPKHMVMMLRKLRDGEDRRIENGAMNRKTVEAGWSWKVRGEAYVEWFERCLE